LNFQKQYIDNFLVRNR